MSTFTTPPGPSSTTSAPAPPPPARKGGISRGTGIAIAAVVVIALLILALLLTGVIPGLKKTSSSPSAAKYDVTFTESGLTSGTSWSITLAGSTLSSSSSTIVFSEKNGTYSFTVGPVSGFAAHPTSGSVTVNGAAVGEPISFAVGYAVTFTETGLPSGTSWSVTLNGSTLSSTSTSIVFTESNGAYPYTIPIASGYTPSPSSGSVTVDNAAVAVPVTFTALAPGTYLVTFTESGLPSGTSWSVTLAGSPMSSTTTTITFSEKNDTYSYAVGAVSGYSASPSSGSVTVNGGPQSVPITFTKSPPVSGAAYAVTFKQTGLPSTDLWGAEALPEINHSSVLVFAEANFGPTTEFAVPNGTYFWDVEAEVSGYGAVPSFGNFTVSGAPVTIDIQFEPLYSVNFTETGLAAGVEWTVTLNGTTSTEPAPANNTFSEVNGTYLYTVSAFGYTASPSSGSVTVNGANTSVSIAFTALPTYDVTFTETGLTAGNLWEATLNGSTDYAVAPAHIVFHMPNGDYPYDVYAAGYTASPHNGTVTVSSAAKTIPIAFTAIPTNNVTFSETGLATGTIWYATVDGILNYTTAPASVVVLAPDGVDPFTVFAPGYRASPASGNVTVSSSTPTVPITFTLIPPIVTYNVTFNETGLPVPGVSDWEVYVQNDGPLLGVNYTCSNDSVAGTPLNCSLADGYYSWVAYTYTANYTASPMSGYFTVDGAGLSVNITYVDSSSDYLVVFDEAWYQIFGTGGLPNGTSWSVTLAGVTQTTEGMWIYFLEPNATTTTYTITAPAGYAALPRSGTIFGYENASQAAEGADVSPLVYLVFVSSDPPGGTPAIAMGNVLMGASSGIVVAATRYG